MYIVAHYTVLEVNTRFDRKVLEKYALNDHVNYILFHAVSPRSFTWQPNYAIVGLSKYPLF